METIQKFANSKEVIAFLAERFPKCFSLEGEAKPLKIGIFQDLALLLSEEERVSKTLLRSTLRHYTNSWRYLESVVEGVSRINLDGESDAIIEAEHAEHAKQLLLESKAKAAEKRKQQNKTKAKRRSDKTQSSPKSKLVKTAQKVGVKAKTVNANKIVPQKLTTDDMVVDTKVTVKLGKVPMPAVITEIAKDGVHVQLETGMVVKVDQSTLRLANTKRS